MRKPFCNLISLFLSIKRDQDSVMNFWDEIYGCVNYLNLPYDTVMNLPVYVRKFWIKKHNRQVEEEQAEMERADNPPATLYPVKGLTLSLKWNKENKDEKAEMPSHFYVSGIYKCMII